LGVDVVPLPNGTQYPSPLTVIEDNSTMINYFVAHQNATQIGLFVHSAYNTLAGFGSEERHSGQRRLYRSTPTTRFPSSTFSRSRCSARSRRCCWPSAPASDVRFEVSWKTMPRAELRVEGFDVVATNGAQWFYIPSMIVFILLLVEMTTEKEKKLRVGMQMMGLKYSAYWLVYIVLARAALGARLDHSDGRRLRVHVRRSSTTRTLPSRTCSSSSSRSRARRSPSSSRR
jgi:hypothetical protein